MDESMSCLGKCFGCNRYFWFNPELVPSIRIDGILEPVCKDCVERVNPIRIFNNLEPIIPLPGAYIDGDPLEMAMDDWAYCEVEVGFHQSESEPKSTEICETNFDPDITYDPLYEFESRQPKKRNKS